MSTPFIGEIRAVSFAFAPRGWAPCNGQILPINQNQALFSILGTTYGGDGQTTFALPNLQGRVPVYGVDGTLGAAAGEERHTLTTAEIPAHTHTLGASGQRASIDDPAGAVWAAPASGSAYASTPTGPMDPTGTSTVGGSQAHENMQPSLVINFVIALTGMYPARS